MGFLPVPGIITEPAVGYGLVLGALFFHESAEQRKHRTAQGVLLPENISVAGIGGTENGTRMVALGHLGFWRKDTWRYRGFVAYPKVNLDFYSLPGVGDLPRPIELEFEGPALFQDIKYRLPGTKVFIGARQIYGSIEGGFAQPEDPATLPPPVNDYFQQNAGRKIVNSAIGPVIEYDSRDNPFNPQRGYFYSTNYTWYDEAIGSDVDYATFNVTALNYWGLGERFNLGLRFQFDGVEADGEERLPAYAPPYIKLRGVPASRYQGNRVLVAEAQLDYKISERWKAGVFSGAGRAADSVDEFGGAEDVYNYGAGFRYLIARRYGFVMGVDIARGPEDTALYIQAGSNW